MFDIKWIRDNPQAFDRAMARRGVPPQATGLVAIDDERRKIVMAMNAAQEKRNALSKEIGRAKAAGDEARAEALMAEVAELKSEVAQGEGNERRMQAGLRDRLAALPNMPLDDVPDGEDESGNVERHTQGRRRLFNFSPREHYELGEALGGMDFATAAKLSGARFVVLKHETARLSRALGQFMLDLHTREHGYTEVQPPLLVKDAALFGTGQLPKFRNDQFAAIKDIDAQEADGEGAERFFLIPTAEVPLTNLVRESILSEDQLPLRFTALTPCFRSEAGAAGKDTRGMIRQHQFEKVELVAVTTPEASGDEHEKMLADAETVLKKLDLHYRVMVLCAGDMGFGARKTYDIEVWLPGQHAYREISSVSVCGDFQARRMDARMRGSDGKPRFVHTLNGSGVAVGRALVAVMENYQQEDGTIAVPTALKPYLGGLETIGGTE